MGMLGLNEIENSTYEIGFNPNLPSIPSSPDSHIIPRLRSPVKSAPASQGVYDQLNNLFSEQDKQKNSILEAREILGESASALTDDQVYDLVSEIQYLADTWLEEYERTIFDGKTLDETLGK